MCRHVLALACIAGAAAHGSGSWKDPHHAKEGSPFAGMRYVAEETHKLTMVGSDDGKTWWTVKGWCDGPGMTHVHYDFSSKVRSRRHRILPVPSFGPPRQSARGALECQLECTHSSRPKARPSFGPLQGGPTDASAVWAKAPDNSVTLTFGDGNAWELMAETNDSAFVPAPKAAAKLAAAGGAKSSSAAGPAVVVLALAGLFAAHKRRSAAFEQIPECSQA